MLQHVQRSNLYVCFSALSKPSSGAVGRPSLANGLKKLDVGRSAVETLTDCGGSPAQHSRGAFTRLFDFVDAFGHGLGRRFGLRHSHGVPGGRDFQFVGSGSGKADGAFASIVKARAGCEACRIGFVKDASGCQQRRVKVRRQRRHHDTRHASRMCSALYQKLKGKIHDACEMKCRIVSQLDLR